MTRPPILLHKLPYLNFETFLCLSVYEDTCLLKIGKYLAKGIKNDPLFWSRRVCPYPSSHTAVIFAGYIPMGVIPTLNFLGHV